MKRFAWNEEKNQKLKAERDISFDDVKTAIEGRKKLVDIIAHPNTKRYPEQKVFVVEIDSYIYMVPYVEDHEKYFLKTIFPSRKMRRRYRKKRE